MSTQALNEALASLIDAFKVDGYIATVSELNGVVEFKIDAGPDACADCLTPPSILVPIVTNALRDAGFQQSVEVKYPSE